jgi:uncharacterized protein (TIGR02246 family)
MSTVETDATIEPQTVAAELFTAMERAWQRADGTAFGKLFTPDADFVEIRGGHHHGVEAIARGHQAIFDTIYAGSTVAYVVERARLLAPGCIVALIGSTLTAPSGPLQGVNSARITAVITERGGEWAIASFHNTLVIA